MKTKIAMVMFALAIPAIGHAQAMPATASALDPARLAAARSLIDLLMPPATREQIIQSMMTPTLVNMRQGMAQNPAFKAMMASDPRAAPIFDDFMKRQEAQVTETMRQSLPGMIDAMTRAYARRFDVKQLTELSSFFSTPTGRIYMQASYTIMADPDIAAWQRTMMAGSMARVQSDVGALVQQLTALETKSKTP